ncbi:MAG: arginase family protein, partial [Methanobrevibacter sp.]|nr:arginase family protein [Methanobrevibacter sp.]
LRPILLGGEHSISYPTLKGLKKKFDIEDTTVVHLDAHMDMIDQYQGEKCSHATVMRRIAELNPKSIVQLGIRSASKEEVSFAESQQSIVGFSPSDFENFDNIKKELLSIEGNVYISIDCDVFDTKYLPGVGNPVPNGISLIHMENILKILSTKNVIGFDVVELSSNKLGDPSAINAAKIVYDFLTLI